MKFNVISLFPDMIHACMSGGVVGNALQKQMLGLECINPREFAVDVHKSVDDRPFGGGDGMVMLVEPLQKAIEAALARVSDRKRTRVIYASPQGRLFTDAVASEYATQYDELILICGRYAGVDQRFINLFVDEELSIGDFVLSGGELAAAVVIDAVSRKLPGVLGNADSAQAESFALGYLECPQFTRPRDYQGQVVPAFLLSGNHRLIEELRESVGWLKTYLRRPEVLLLPQAKLLVLFKQHQKSVAKQISVDELKTLGFTKSEIETIKKNDSSAKSDWPFDKIH